MFDGTTRLMIGSTPHESVLFCMLVGQSSQSRKGTVTRDISAFLHCVDPTFDKNIIQGLSTSQGIVYEVHDERIEFVASKKEGEPSKLQSVDAGVQDKRRLVIENELGLPLAVMKKVGSTLRSTLRLIWDCVTIGNLARSNRDRCEHPNISMITSITNDEPQSQMRTVDKTNGFINRFLLVLAKRGCILPYGGKVDEVAINALAVRVRDVLAWAHGEEVVWGDARELWAKTYRELSERNYSGLLGEVTARAEAQIMRIAFITALLDESDQISIPHLNAALEVWRFCEESARNIFATVRNLDVERLIYEVACKTPGGLTRTAMSNLFHGHKTEQQLQTAFTWLEQAQMLYSKEQKVEGKSLAKWFVL